MNTAIEELWGPDEEQALLDSIDAWVEKSVAPIAREYDLEDKYPHELVEEMKELGLFGATISTEYGGLGLPARIYAKIVIKVSSVWMAPTGIFNSHLIMAAAIERCGTEEQKRKYLPRMATGELRGSLGLTEPNAGTDLQAIRSVARRDGDHYVINGAKTWITNSMYGNMVLLLVKTDPEAQPRHKGMSMFIAEKGDGFVVAKKLQKSGYKAIDTCELVFQDYRVPADCLLGGEEGQGFLHAVGGLELGRINVAARGCGIAEGALRLSVRYAQERTTFGKPICEHQAIQLKLGEMAARGKITELQSFRHLPVAKPCFAGAACFAGSAAQAHRTRVPPVKRPSPIGSARIVADKVASGTRRFVKMIARAALTWLDSGQYHSSGVRKWDSRKQLKRF